MTTGEILAKTDELVNELQTNTDEARAIEINKQLDALDREWRLNEAQFSPEYDAHEGILDDDGQPTEQQENEDFAHDDDFHNMSASDMI